MYCFHILLKIKKWEKYNSNNLLVRSKDRHFLPVYMYTMWHCGCQLWNCLFLPGNIQKEPVNLLQLSWSKSNLPMHTMRRIPIVFPSVIALHIVYDRLWWPSWFNKSDSSWKLHYFRFIIEYQWDNYWYSGILLPICLRALNWNLFQCDLKQSFVKLQKIFPVPVLVPQWASLFEPVLLGYKYQGSEFSQKLSPIPPAVLLWMWFCFSFASSSKVGLVQSQYQNLLQTEAMRVLNKTKKKKNCYKLRTMF